MLTRLLRQATDYEFGMEELSFETNAGDGGKTTSDAGKNTEPLPVQQSKDATNSEVSMSPETDSTGFSGNSGATITDEGSK